MKILVDLHHQGLFYSLQLLFEKRLGWEVYRPIGTDWYYEGFWKVYDHPATVAQFLDESGATKQLTDVHGTPLLKKDFVNSNPIEEDGVFYVTSSLQGTTQRAITLKKFKETKFDILLSSIPEHIAPYNKLIELYQPQAKHIFQVGNAWGHQPGTKNILASTAPFPVPSDINACFYHQEFDLDIYSYKKPTKELYESKKVNSYIHYMQRKDLMNQVASILQPKGFNFTSYGAGMEDCLHSNKDIANAYQESLFTWHYKPEGDGYGYCYSPDTEILTKTGWKLFPKLEPGEEVSTFNTETKAFEWQVPTDYQSFNYDGDMIHFSGRTIDLLVTPQHRMWVERYNKKAKGKGWKFLTAEECFNLGPKTEAHWRNYRAYKALGFQLAAEDWQGQEGQSLDWATLCGWYLSEGCCWTNRQKSGKLSSRGICLFNTNPQYIQEIEITLTNLGYKFKKRLKPDRTDALGFHKPCYEIRVNSPQLYEYFHSLGTATQKYIPRELLNANKEFLRTLIKTFMKGDGHRSSGNTQWETNLASKKLIDDLQECCIKLGLRSRVEPRPITGITKSPIWRLRVSDSHKTINKNSVKKLYKPPSKIKYTGLVYCVTVPNQALFVRRNGIPVVSGNSPHCSYACGRPLIVQKSFYKGKLADSLMIEGQTCLSIDGLTPGQIATKIATNSHPDRHLELCENSYRRFQQIVNFDNEFEKIKKFLERLQ